MQEKVVFAGGKWLTEMAMPGYISLSQKLTLPHGTDEGQRWSFIKTGLGNFSPQTLPHSLGKSLGRVEKLH